MLDFNKDTLEMAKKWVEYDRKWRTYASLKHLNSDRIDMLIFEMHFHRSKIEKKFKDSVDKHHGSQDTLYHMDMYTSEARRCLENG